MLQVYSFYQNRLIYEALKEMLGSMQSLELIGGSHIKDIASRDHQIINCKVILLEMDLPDSETIKSIKEISFLHPHKDIFILGSNGSINRKVLSNILELDIAVYLFKDCSKLDLINAFQKIRSHEKYICTKVFSKIIRTGNSKKEVTIELSPRESQILSLLVQGKLNKNVADTLFISESTVKTHRRNIMDKLGASNMITLISNAIEANILSMEDLPFCPNQK